MSKYVHVSNTLIIDNEGHYVASTTNCYESEQTNAANALRIAACLNACAGINPEAVPDVVVALRVLMYHECNACTGVDEYGGHSPSMVTPDFDAARAALAKLEGNK